MLEGQDFGAKEDFCETLVHYCLDLLPEGELMDRFLQVVG